MKTIKISFTILAIAVTMACANNQSDAPKSSTMPTKNIVGTWQIIASDFRLDSIAEPTGKWIYVTEKDKEALRNVGMNEDDANFTFLADGTGYVGNTKTEEMAFTYNKLPNDRYSIKASIDDGETNNTNEENIEEFYTDNKGQLIYHHTSKPMLMGKYVIQHTFELLKRK
jgi:hypothetical protein